MTRPPAQRGEKELEFHKWRSNVSLPGIRGPRNDQPCNFIPVSELRTYLDRTKLEHLLDAVLENGVRHQVDTDHVLEHYLRPFAILLCLDKGYLIHHFYKYMSLRDGQLPIRVRPDDFPHVSDSFFDDFKREQWQFCATELHLNMNVHLREEDILPFVRKEKLGHGGSAIVYKITIEPSYNSLFLKDPQSTSQTPKTFVLKTFREHEAEANHKAELDAYRKLSTSSPYIVKCYGSFVRKESNSYSLILEYADRGTLEDFMKTTERPQKIEDSILFWHRLSGVIRGLAAIHNATTEQNPSRQTLVGWHQDVKPANILVFSGSGKSRYDCFFKIADLGLSHFKAESPQQISSSDFDAYGTRAYGAPETFRHDEAFETCPLLVKQDVDLWSAGSVYSEAATWATFGYRMVREYRRRRKDEVRDGGGADGEYLFHHNDQVPLKVVKEFHQTIKSRGEAHGLVTRRVLSVVDMMLQVKGCRSNAMTIHACLGRIISDLEEQFEVSVTGRQDHHHTQPSSSSADDYRIRTPTQVLPSRSRLNTSPHKMYHLPSIQRPASTSDSSMTDLDPRAHVHTRSQRIDPNRNGSFQRRRHEFAESHNRRSIRSAGAMPDQESPDHPSLSIARATTSHAGMDTQHLQTSKALRHKRYFQERHATLPVESDQFEHNESKYLEQPGHSSMTSQHPPYEPFDGAAKNPNKEMSDSDASKNISSNQTPSMTQQQATQDNSHKRDFLTLDQGLHWKADFKKRKKIFGLVPELPGSHHLPTLGGRDHVFIIDNSESMKTHILTIKKVVGLHGYILKSLDPTGLDIHYTNSLRKKNSKKSTQLVKSIDLEPFSGQNTDMKGRLMQIFEEYIPPYDAIVTPMVSRLSTISQNPTSKLKRPISFYILTDGKWQPGNDVASVILEVVDNMIARRLAKERVAIQFIRFGNDSDGIACMDRLDHGLGLKEKGMDIVDTTYCEDNIWKQLIGAVNDWYDDDPN